MTFMELPEQIQLHMKSLISSSDLPDTSEFKKLLANTWDRKCRLFEQQAKILDMEIVNLVFFGHYLSLLLMLLYLLVSSRLLIGQLHLVIAWDCLFLQG